MSIAAFQPMLHLQLHRLLESGIREWPLSVRSKSGLANGGKHMSCSLFTTAQAAAACKLLLSCCAENHMQVTSLPGTFFFNTECCVQNHKATAMLILFLAGVLMTCCHRCACFSFCSSSRMQFLFLVRVGDVNSV
eukprot:4240115-Pleurochrysis_carterae.AAC.1